VEVDALSRCNEEHLLVHALSYPHFEFYEQFRREAASLTEIAAVHEEILADCLLLLATSSF
jgi:hypothetical protein